MKRIYKLVASFVAITVAAICIHELSLPAQVEVKIEVIGLESISRIGVYPLSSDEAASLRENISQSKLDPPHYNKVVDIISRLNYAKAFSILEPLRFRFKVGPVLLHIPGKGFNVAKVVTIKEGWNEITLESDDVVGIYKSDYLEWIREK
jgi:hypothetical protein